MSQSVSTHPRPQLTRVRSPRPTPPAASDARSAPRRRHHHVAWRFLASPRVLALGDLALLFGAFLLAYTARYTWRLGPALNEFQFTPLDAYWVVAGLFIPVTLLSFASLGRYQRHRGTSLLEDLGRIAVGTLIGTAAVIVVFFVSRPVFFSRLMFLYLGTFGLGLAVVWVLVRRLGLGLLRRAGYDNQRILVVGGGAVAKFLMQQLTANRSLGNRVIGYLDSNGNGSSAAFGRFARLGTVDDLAEVIESEHVDVVYAALPSSVQHELAPVIERCRHQGVQFRVVPDLLEAQFGRMDIHPVAGIPLVTLREPEITGFRYMQKRALDLVVSILGLLLTAPLWVLIGLAIRLDSPGPILFRQTRIGRDGQSFRVFKFRSMVQDAEKRKHELFDDERHPLLFKAPNDQRRTRVGRLLRRMSVDELPQLLNVLLGHMSLVGPRAQVPAEVAQYDNWARHRLRVLPGLTGLWQVSGRSDLGFDEMVMLDTFYVSNWSLGLDLRILLQTIPTVLSGRGAY